MNFPQHFTESKKRFAIISAIPLVLLGGLAFVFFNGKAEPPAVGAVAQVGDYRLITGVRGYVSKPDPTNTPEDFLVRGSQNVIINDQEKVESRSGYEIFGQASTTANPVKSDFSWTNSTGGEILLRESGGVLQFLPNATSTPVMGRNFENLLGGLNSTATSSVRFATVWNNSEQIDVLLFVNGTPTLYEWSGGQGTFSASTATTIDINEDISSSTSRFFTSGTRELRIKDANGTWQTFSYTGRTGKQFTGISPDPTAFTFPTNALVVQAVRSNANTPSSNFNSDVIKVLYNQVWLGSYTSQKIYISKDTSYTNFNFSSPRVAGEGAEVILDSYTVGMESPDDKSMIVFSGGDRIYQITFEVSPGSSSDREVPRTRPLLVSSGQGAISQELIGKIKQAIVWVNRNQELVELGQVENLPAPQSVAISDPIKPDFSDADFTGGEIEFWRNSIFISAPPDGKVFIFDLSKRFWQPPQIMDVRRFSVYDDLLYSHSQSVPQTYKLFTGTNDNDNPISFKAHFAYQNGGRRDALKNFDRFFTELYLSSNTTLDVKLLYEWQGAKQELTYQLDGSTQDFLFTPSPSSALGVNPLGTNPLGSVLVGSETPKYRRFKPIVPADFFEMQVRIETEDSDASFEILSHGSNMRMSGNLPSKLTK